MSKKINTPRHSGLPAGTAEQAALYELGGITFVATPVYKDSGETVREILERLMKNDAQNH